MLSCARNLARAKPSLKSKAHFSARSIELAKSLNQTLKEADPELWGIIQDEKVNQRDVLALIASENYTSKSVFEALGSPMCNKYSHGYPGARYYGNLQNIDRAERLCQQRAIEAFGLDPEKWGVNVQSLSGSPANFQVYAALMEPNDRLMSLDILHGGHLSHGYQTDKKKISSVSLFFQTLPYRTDIETGLIDYDTLEKNAGLFHPKIIIAGASNYTRLIDYDRIRSICDAHNSYMVADIAHIGGLVAARVIPTPFDTADIVTTTTHKSLRGPRGALIFFRRGVKGKSADGQDVMYDLESKINYSVYPRFQGGPHNHTIAALATSLKQACSPEYKAYQHQVVANSKRFAAALKVKGFKLVADGTDNHQILVNVQQSRGVDGARVEKVLELANISANSSPIPGDANPAIPGGVRLGTPALTTRGFTENDFEEVASFFDRAVTITAAIGNGCSGGGNGGTMDDFKASLDSITDLQKLKEDVTSFARQFPTVGYEL